MQREAERDAREEAARERQTDRDKNEMPPPNICVRENGEERDAKEKREGEREKWEEGREREREMPPPKHVCE